jgi:hypothetical protein
MIILKHLLAEQTTATLYCKRDVLSRAEFSADKWKAIGIMSKRNIAGTNISSEHSIGNAIDWHGKKGPGDPVMQKLANYLVKNATKYNIVNVIYNNKIWNYPAGWHSYTGKNPHIDHVHVDFKRTKQSADKQKNNDAIQKAIWIIYNTITKYPQRHFKQFSSFFNDDEESASKYFNDLYSNKVNNPILKKIELSCTLEDRLSIESLRSACKQIYYMIKNGKTGSIPVEFYKWNKLANQYKLTIQNIKWNYM